MGDTTTTTVEDLENNAVEMFNPDSGKSSSLKGAFTAKVYVVDTEQEDGDIDMDLTMEDINRAFVSKSADATNKVIIVHMCVQ
jgi:hypothetical protein